MSISAPPNGWTRYGAVIVPDQPWENLILPAYTAESTILSYDGTWRAWYSTSNGIGYATAADSLGPWTKYDPALTPAALTDPSFETDVTTPGVADGWTVVSTVGGTPIFSQVAGRIGGNAQRIQYTAQAGDTGKTIWLQQTTPGTIYHNQTVVASVWAKGSVTGGAYVSVDPLILPADQEGKYVFTPASSWTEISSPTPMYAAVDNGSGVQLRIIRIEFASDVGSVDITVDDAALSWGTTNPVVPGGYSSRVTVSGGSYYMFLPGDSSNLVYRTSADGFVWSVTTQALPAGTGADPDTRICNPGLFLDDDGTWYLFYEGYTSGGAPSICVATAPAITGPWTKYPGNPLIAGGGRPCMLKVGDTYLLYFHSITPDAPNGGPCRASGTTPLNVATDQFPVFLHEGGDEGPTNPTSQVVDLCVVDDGSQYVMYYTAAFVAGPYGDEHIKAATAPYGALPWPPALSRTVPLASGSGQNFAMTAGEHVVVTFTTDTPVSEVASAEWVAVEGFGGADLITKTTTIVLSVASDGTSTVATIELLGTDTALLDGLLTHQLWFYDATGDGVVVASGSLVITPSLVAP